MHCTHKRIHTHWLYVNYIREYAWMQLCFFFSVISATVSDNSWPVFAYNRFRFFIFLFVCLKINPFISIFFHSKTFDFLISGTSFQMNHVYEKKKIVNTTEWINLSTMYRYTNEFPVSFRFKFSTISPIKKH